MERMGVPIDQVLVQRVTSHVKEIGRKGRTVDEEELLLITGLYSDIQDCNDMTRTVLAKRLKQPQPHFRPEHKIDFTSGPPMHN